MSLQEEELVSSHAGQPEQASSLLDQIMAQTRIQPGSEGYDVARQGVTAFIASILQSTASAEPVNKLVVDSMIADIDERISRQMDVIIHAPAFQQVESFWRSLKTSRSTSFMSPSRNFWKTLSLRQKLFSPDFISTFIRPVSDSLAVNPSLPCWALMSSKIPRLT